MNIRTNSTTMYRYFVTTKLHVKRTLLGGIAFCYRVSDEHRYLCGGWAYDHPDWIEVIW